MALSNWDSLSFTMHGPSLDSAVTNHENHTIEIYKNEVHISGPQAARTKRWLRPPETPVQALGRIEYGELIIGQWHITAVRGPQAGVYVVAHSARWDSLVSDDGDRFHDKTLLVGCGVYGYREPVGEEHRAKAQALGVDPDTLMVGVTGSHHQLIGMRDGQLVVVTAADDADLAWEGVLPSSVEYLKTLVDQEIEEGGWPAEVLRALPWDRAERCNQGDRYFGDQGVDVPDLVTAPGAAVVPLIHRALDADEQS
jgi:hypothetical protein